MENQDLKSRRILAYHQAEVLSNEDLLAVSGGVTKLTCGMTHKGTGVAPAGLDVIDDFGWD